MLCPDYAEKNARHPGESLCLFFLFRQERVHRVSAGGMPHDDLEVHFGAGCFLRPTIRISRLRRFSSTGVFVLGDGGRQLDAARKIR